MFCQQRELSALLYEILQQMHNWVPQFAQGTPLIDAVHMSKIALRVIHY
jgi:hypothetical protein